MRATGVPLLGVLLTLVLLGGCDADPPKDGPGGEPPNTTTGLDAAHLPALPDLAGVDPEVAKVVRAAHELLRTDSSVAAIGRYGRVLHAHGMLPAAEDVYLRAADAAGEDGFEFLYLAATVTKDRDAARALAHVNRALELRTDFGNAYVLAGRLHEAADDLDAAKRAFDRAISAEPTSHAAFGLGRVALAQGDHARAVHHFESALNARPDHHEILAPLARAYSLAGRDADAELTAARVEVDTFPTTFSDEYLRAVLREGTSYQGYVSRAGDAAARGERAEAIELFGRAIEKRPKTPETLLSRAILLSELERYDEALADIRRVLNLKVGHAGALCLAARCHVALGDRDEAERALRAALEIRPEHRLARYALAQVLLPERREEARRILAVLVSELPGFVDGRLLFARVLADLGETEHALLHVKLILRQQPENELAGALRAELER